MPDRIQWILALFFLILLAPLMLVIALLLPCFSGFPVFYRSRRLGRGKRLFTIAKFRSMQPGTEAFVEKCPDDPRITPFGRILRRFSLDELPQLWNVVCGDMVLVGPRPIVDEEDVLYGKYSAVIHSVKPGITGLWQVSGRNLTTFRRRIAINIYYVRHRSWRLDLWILYKTVWAVIGGRGAF